MSIEFRPYDANVDHPALNVFTRETYGPSFFDDAAYVDWWFASSPARHSDGSSNLLIAVHDEHIVGMNGHIATDVHRGSATMPLHWLANTMVHPAYRSRGLGVKLLAESVRRFKNVGSISFRPDAARILDHLGFDLFGLRRMARAVAIFDRRVVVPGVLDDLLTQELAHASPVQPDVSRGLVRLSEHNIACATEVWERVATRYGLSTVRSVEHLEWRYLHHPSRAYEIYAFPEVEPRAIGIVRVDGATLTAARIVDAWGESDSVEPLLFRLLASMRQRGCAFADFFCTGRPDLQSFERAGFVWLLEERAGAVPFLLNPPEMRPYHEQLALVLSDPPTRVAYEETYFTRGDADRDRPPVSARSHT